MTTDGKGRWYSDVMPAKLSDVSIRLTAPNYVCERTAFAASEPFFKPLLAAEAVIRAKSGVNIEGVVISSEGQPISGAEVLQGPRSERDSITVRTDADGHFAFAHAFKPGGVQLTISASNFSPRAELVKAAAEMEPLRFALERGYTLQVRVVDGAGLPVVGASVSASLEGRFNSTKPSAAANTEFRTKTDAEGRFKWVNERREDINLDILKSGILTARGVKVMPSSEEQLVKLDPNSRGVEIRVPNKLTVRGRVLDGENQNPILKFRITPGAPNLWLSGSERHTNQYWINDKAQTFSNGTFEITFNEQLIRGSGHDGYYLRIDADGFAPVLSREFNPAAKTVTFDAKLRRAQNISGIIRSPDGEPYVDGVVILLNGNQAPQILHGMPVIGATDSTFLKTDEAGRYTIRPQLGSYFLLVASEVGFARVSAADLEQSPDFAIQKWAMIVGSMIFGSTPATNTTLGLAFDPEQPSAPNRLIFNDTAVPNEQGHFRFEHVPPGRIQVIRRDYHGPNSWGNIPIKTLTVQAGETIDLNLGSEGLGIFGRLVLASDATNTIHFAELRGSVNPDLPLPPVPTTIDSDDDRRAWFTRWNATDEGRKFQEDVKRTYPVHVSEDGRFRADGIPAGQYRINFTLIRQTDRGSEVAGSAFKRIQIPADSSRTKVDVGTIEFRSRRELNVGDMAPPFVAQGLDERPVSLADFHGKYVLLHFWSRWCVTCLQEFPTLQSLQEEYRSEPRIVVMSVSTDRDLAIVRKFVRERKLNWLQTWNSADSSSSINDYSYHLPATFLISPEGRIVARDLRGDGIKQKVRAALAENR